MKNNFSVSIAKPCSADWNKMSPSEQGKFCGLCSLTVVDFTKMNNQEIKEYFLCHQNKKTCGRFNTSQVTNTPTLHPKIVLYIKQSHLKALAFSILSLLTFLIGCRKPASNSRPHMMGDVSFETMGEPKFNIEQVDTITTTPRTIIGDTTYIFKQLDTIKTIPNPEKQRK